MAWTWVNAISWARYSDARQLRLAANARGELHRIHSLLDPVRRSRCQHACLTLRCRTVTRRIASRERLDQLCGAGARQATSTRMGPGAWQWKVSAPARSPNGRTMGTPADT